MFKHADKVVLGIDIGGSHISSALVYPENWNIKEGTFSKNKIETQQSDPAIILENWIETIKQSLAELDTKNLEGIGVAMPGPFDYTNGISLLDGVSKYGSLYGINIKEIISSQLNLPEDCPIAFENDAGCFGLGEALVGDGKDHYRVIAITLGTGFGAAFIENKKLIKADKRIPANGYLYNIPYKNGLAEDYISSRWLIKKYNDISGKGTSEVKEIADAAAEKTDTNAIGLFENYGIDIANCLTSWITSFKADCIVIGGSISKSSELFLPALLRDLKSKSIDIPVKISKKMELFAIAGAAGLISQDSIQEKKINESKPWRKSSQPLLPQHIPQHVNKKEDYNIYPFQHLGEAQIFSGFRSLADWFLQQKTVAIDGFIGNDWQSIRSYLSNIFKEKNLNVLWYETSAFAKQEEEIEKLVKPFLGPADSIWGTKTNLQLQDFYDHKRLANLQLISKEYDIIIIIGVGAGLCKQAMPLIYIDLPKNEIQYRMRAGSISNLGTAQQFSLPETYKRFYFVDWVVLSSYRESIKNKISIVADAQWMHSINWSFYSAIAKGLETISKTTIRVRPWFQAGAWGGQWMKNHISSLNKNEVNYAWSFELIVPENGIVFESDGNLLEVSFDWLMDCCSENILGKDKQRFGKEFPIRFDFLDTFDGGNLSIQCHPSLEYIRENFGENITQDETYYILDCKEDAGVYLGFQDDIKPGEFREELEKSEEARTPIEIEKYVQCHPSHKHDLFLIPNKTIHSAGKENLVLEISATPYIFTFKMYDWVRLDLDGEPRPISIQHAFNNLDFDRKGNKVKSELISQVRLIEKNDQYELFHLPTHAEHFYDVHRLEFMNDAFIKTNDQCHVLMLVEGTAVMVKMSQGVERQFNYAETFIIPAAAKEYQLINLGKSTAKVIKAFIK
ncbi:MAG: ROK family protein [Ginsengibacter sp.]